MYIRQIEMLLSPSCIVCCSHLFTCAFLHLDFNPHAGKLTEKLRIRLSNASHSIMGMNTLGLETGWFKQSVNYLPFPHWKNRKCERIRHFRLRLHGHTI